jgi:MFS family permease
MTGERRHTLAKLDRATNTTGVEDGARTQSHTNRSTTGHSTAGQQPAVSLDAEELKWRQSMQAYSKLLEKGTPWLYDVGSWVFGGLIAFTVLIIGALITIGPVDLAIKVSTAALAFALPLDVTGLVLLRLAQDLKPGQFEQEVSETFQEAGLSPDGVQVPSLTSLQAMRIRGTRIALGAAFGILTVSIILTLAGLGAALWHMTWWIAIAFVAMVALCLLFVTIAMSVAQPPVSAEEKRRRKAYSDEVVRQAKVRTRQEKATLRARQKQEQASAQQANRKR